MSTRETVGVIGVGYVGLVTAACLAELGHHVVCRDIAPERVAMLQRGEVPIHEPGVPELLQRNAERLTFTLDMEDVFQDARIAIICVDTPPTASGDADLSRVEAVIAALPASAEGAVLVMKSTVPVGTGTRVRSELDARGRQDVGYVSNPEFLREGSAVADFRQPDRVVVGGDRPEDVERVARLYQDLNAPILTTDIASAEMIKLASNAFLATKISFVNEIANVCERVGADVEEVARGMGMDSRIGQSFLRPGIGYGGSCFPKDVTALKQLAGNTGYSFQLLASVIEVNELQKRRVIGKLQDRLGSLRGRRVALLGLAFKPHTDDMREASSIVLASRLIAEGASVVAFDPVAAERARGVLPESVEIAGSMLAAVTDADAVVIVTEWPEFRAVLSAEVHAAMRGPLIVDGRNLLDPNEAVAAGFTYVPIGRAERDPERELRQA
ncbi:MAG: UDP-glucose/GDP-mannose dehydrogenase family protein [Thermoleophilia bacterium]|nr:UDP-glucose/GDP-mannose dehydrogenase family protein [Thermoleophilia bacterium]